MLEISVRGQFVGGYYALEVGYVTWSAYTRPLNVTRQGNLRGVIECYR